LEDYNASIFRVVAELGAGLFFDFLFDPEDGGDTLLRNV
jgi:hypothetical protein